MQLDAGTGPDLLYARSYETGRELYSAGFLQDVSDVPGVKENFVASSLEPWQNADGTLFAVPFAAVSQVIYYNKDIFAENNLEVPATWDEFIAVCDALKAAGVTPIGNGLASNWDILECVFLGMLPNYVGGAEERAKYESGEKKLNDEAFLQAYTDFTALTAYLPEGYASIGNDDGIMEFALGRTAMVIDGSWSCGTLDEYGVNWGSMAFPVPASGSAAVCFHPDMAIAGNAATAYPEEVKAFLAWIATPEGAQVAADYLPAGFFPMINAPITFKNERMTDILSLNEGKITDARFIWPSLMALYDPMLEQLNALTRGETTPQAAADAVAALVK
jgi:raffinose/stachyose/melibiose transport system substrate-binding protein